MEKMTQPMFDWVAASLNSGRFFTLKKALRRNALWKSFKKEFPNATIKQYWFHRNAVKLCDDLGIPRLRHRNGKTSVGVIPQMTERLDKLERQLKSIVSVLGLRS